MIVLNKPCGPDEHHCENIVPRAFEVVDEMGIVTSSDKHLRCLVCRTRLEWTPEWESWWQRGGRVDREDLVKAGLLNA